MESVEEKLDRIGLCETQCTVGISSSTEYHCLAFISNSSINCVHHLHFIHSPYCAVLYHIDRKSWCTIFVSYLKIISKAITFPTVAYLRFRTGQTTRRHPRRCTNPLLPRISLPFSPYLYSPALFKRSHLLLAALPPQPPYGEITSQFRPGCAPTRHDEQLRAATQEIWT